MTVPTPFSSNTEMLRDALQAFTASDLDSVIAYIHPEIRWETSGIFPGLEPLYEGREGVRRFWAEFMEPWDAISVEPLEIIEPYGDRIIAQIRFRGIARPGRGDDMDIELWQLYVLRDSALIFFRAFPEREQAMEAARAA